MPGQKGLNFRTKIGDLVVILNSFVGESFQRTDINLIKERVLEGRRPRALFLDSGMANLKGKTADSIDLTKKIEERLREEPIKGRVVFNCYDEDLFTISQIIKLAKRNQKKIFIYGLSASKMFH